MPRRRVRISGKSGGAPVWALLVGIVLIGSFFKGHDKPTSPAVSPPAAPAIPSQAAPDTKPRSAPVTAAPPQISMVPPAAVPSAPVTTPSVVPAPETGSTKLFYIKSNRVALRDGPGKNFKILDRYNQGRAVEVVQTIPDWSRVIDKLTRKEGWVSTSLLSSQDVKGDEEPKVETKPKKDTLPVLPRISDDDIARRIIDASIAGHDGPCACPYQRDRRNHSCGKRSAYNRPGGYAPLCFRQDVSAAAIAAFRRQLSD